MTQEEKQLLLKDLCARLPYGVKVKTLKGIGYIYAINTSQLIEITVANESQYWSEVFNINNCKPYLRPMSSMTEEEKEEFDNLVFGIGPYYGEELIRYTMTVAGPNGFKHEFCIRGAVDSDWLDAHHFDYRGLIEKGLALEAPEGMYK